MIAMRENNNRAYLNDTPWLKKSRPGIRPAHECKSADFLAPPRPAFSMSPDPITAGMAMPKDVPEHRLPRKAETTEDGEIFTARNAALILVVAILALTIYWGVAVFVVATDRGGDAVNYDSSTPKEGALVGAAVPEAKDQNRAGNSPESGAR